MAFLRRTDVLSHCIVPSIRCIVLSIVICIPSKNIALAQDQQCTLCADGSPPDLSLRSSDLDWSCSELNSFAVAANLKQGDAECTDLQIVGFQDCACPTFPDSLCSLCPAGFSDIPNKDISVPSTTDLTCGDILFVEESLLDGGCADLMPYRERCGCPMDVPCTYCADGSMPQEPDRKLPYLTTTAQDPVTCAEQANLAFQATEEQCNEITVAPVAVNGQAYCGCEGTFPSNLCSLCPDGGTVVNPDLVVPGTNGMTCSEIAEYLPFITNSDSCVEIARLAEVSCCNAFEACPVCEGGANVNYNEDKVYEPYGLTCEFVGSAAEFGFPMSCQDAQTRLPYFCECPGAIPRCTLCQLGELPPDMDKQIPLIKKTCKETNDYISIRLTSECAAEKASLSFDASAFCGCTGFDAPKQCNFCPEGQQVTNPTLVPVLGDGATCAELEEFADYVRSASLCSSVQTSALQCCRDPNAPTISPTDATAMESAAPSSPGATLSPTGSMPTPLPTGAPIQPPTGNSASHACTVVFPAFTLAVLTSVIGSAWLV